MKRIQIEPVEFVYFNKEVIPVYRCNDCDKKVMVPKASVPFMGKKLEAKCFHCSTPPYWVPCKECGDLVSRNTKMTNATCDICKDTKAQIYNMQKKKVQLLKVHW